MLHLPTEEDFKKAMVCVSRHAHRTPVLTSQLLNAEFDNQLFFKCENFQKTGSFKIRGALNAINQIPEDRRMKGVITHSSGNFAQALSLAASMLGVPAQIVMPHNAPAVKVEAVKAYGGKIVFSGNTIQDREETTADLMEKSGACFIHPSDNIDVIIGQGTAACELIEDTADLDVIFAPVGGGGLIGGTAMAAAHFSNQTICFGGEPENAADAKHSLALGKIVKPKTTNTIADGLKTYLGLHNFPIVQKHVKEIYLVGENDIIDNMRLIYERLKIVVEPSSAVALAAVRKANVSGKRIGIILSGGNVDLEKLPF